MITVSDFQAHHAAACAAIMAENALWQRYGVTIESARQRFENAAHDANALIKIVLAGDEVQGFIWYYVQGTFYSGGYIRLVGVASTAQGKGIGRHLMNAAETHISQHTRDVFLLASDFNTDAHRFYERLGYRSAGALPDYVQAGITEMIFWKRLVQRGESID